MGGGGSNVETKGVVGGCEFRQRSSVPRRRRRRGARWRVGLCICHIHPAKKVVRSRFGGFGGLFMSQSFEAL